MSVAAGAGQTTLLVASTGGHLEELARLRPRLLAAAEQVTWLTFDDAQSRSLLAGERVLFVRHVPPRGYRQAALTFGDAVGILRGHRYQRVISTGAAVAVPFLAVGRALGLSCHYIESAARAQGPSLTGTVVSRLPGVHLHCQYAAWASGRWSYGGSVFDTFRPRAVEPRATAGGLRVVVTLGTTAFGFRRAVERLASLLPQVAGPDGQVLWQVGDTDTSGLGIEAHRTLPARQLHDAIAQADLVIAHAGVGSALSALDAGRCPVLLPRLRAFGEHVDDHQAMIADDLARRGLAVSCAPEQLELSDLVAATRTGVTTTVGAAGFDLSKSR